MVDYEPLPAVVDPAKAAQKGAPLIHDSAPNNTIYNWHIGDPAATEAAFKNAKHVTKLEFINNRLVPNAMEPRAALAEYDSASGHLTLVERDAEPARRPPRHRRLRRHGARAQIARHRARRRRRFRLEDFHLSGRGGLSVGGSKTRPAGEVDLRALGKFHYRRPRPRSRHQGANGVRRRRQDHRLEGAHHRQSRRLYVDFLVGGADLPLCHLAVGPVRDPAHLLRGRRGLYQHRAGRRLSRRRPSGSDLRRGAAGRSRRA